MILKIVGGVLVIVSCSGIGMYMAARWKAHIMALEGLKKMIFMLKGEILYANAPLEEAFGRVGRRCQGLLGEFFVDISHRIEEQCGEPFYKFWKEEVDKLGDDTELSKKDRQELTAFGEHLGYLDSQMQERTILLYLEQLDLALAYLREHQAEKSRLYTSLGIMGGIFLTIVLC